MRMSSSGQELRRNRSMAMGKRFQSLWSGLSAPVKTRTSTAWWSLMFQKTAIPLLSERVKRLEADDQ